MNQCKRHIKTDQCRVACLLPCDTHMHQSDCCDHQTIAHGVMTSHYTKAYTRLCMAETTIIILESDKVQNLPQCDTLSSLLYYPLVTGSISILKLGSLGEYTALCCSIPSDKVAVHLYNFIPSHGVQWPSSLMHWMCVLMADSSELGSNPGCDCGALYP